LLTLPEQRTPPVDAGGFLFSQAPSGAFIFLLLYIQNIADLYRITESLVGQGIRELKKI